MNIDINGTNIGELIEFVSWGVSIFAMLLVGLLVYLMVRPPRHIRRRRRDAPPPRELSPDEGEELWALVDRMEARLAVLERAIGDESGRSAQRSLESTAERRDNGRKE
ncbi:hypothetical protein GCM10023232_24630 [Sphingosinicella ginsenosidimutans]|uniref:Uncharacterized protein n=1 Tax=Allosphingosinicella ginsenosidimutans TaxID=1176539 RepID=A0A5C6TU82_9SPHN|nr:hypothetical protein [Sphingosinicella ginsenosidimutans]TXC63897.1 hypothetical protein FRZ32_09655 [Sphingosinicella ginsenosidimutans]